jgi:hypothetical protein
MTTPSPPSPGKHSRWTVALGLTGMAGLGLLAGGVAAAATFLLFFQGEGEYGGVLFLFGLCTLVPAALLGWLGNRSWRAFAFGLASFWVAGPLVIWWAERDPGMDPAEINEVEARILAAERTAYFVGEEANGQDLDDVYFSDDVISFGYGESCGQDFCSFDTSIETIRRGPASQSWQMAQCQRLPPVRGVPTVELRGPNLINGGPIVMLFTGHLRVAIETEGTRDDDDLDRAVDVAHQLRPLGTSSPQGSLPAPSPTLRAQVDQECPTAAK